jgi:glutaredoxin
MIEIWSKPNCPFCDKAENLCIQKNLNFKKYMLDVDFSREELFEKFPTGKNFSSNNDRWGFNWRLYRILCKNT